MIRAEQTRPARPTNHLRESRHLPFGVKRLLVISRLVALQAGLPVLGVSEVERLSGGVDENGLLSLLLLAAAC